MSSRLACKDCQAVYDGQQPACPDCGCPSVINQMWRDRGRQSLEKPGHTIPARGWIWGSVLAIILWLIFGYIVLKIDGGL